MARRVTVIVLLAGLLLALAAVLHAVGPQAAFWPKCPLHQATGLHCPGCGMTRAVHACLRGDVGLAFRHNLLMMVLLPVLGLWLAWMLGFWVRGLPLPQVALSGKWRWLFAMVMVLVVVFGILRNLPQWPFTLLAPP